MRPEFLQSLNVRADTIGQRWETLLRVEANHSQLWNVEALAPTIPDSLAAIFAALAHPVRGPHSIAAQRAQVPACPCGRNPGPLMFHAAEQAFVESLERLQAELPLAARRPGDCGEMRLAVGRIGRTSVDAHCATCAHRQLDPRCRFLPTNS